MSQQNVEFARQVLQAINDRDLGSLAEFLGSEIAWHTDPLVPEPGIYEGRERVLAYLEGYVRAFGGGIRFDVHEVTDLGDDQVLVVTTFFSELAAARGAETAVLDWCFIARIHDRQVVRLRSFLDRARALEAAGLRE